METNSFHEVKRLEETPARWMELILVAEASAHRDALAALGAAAREHGGPALGLHTAAEAVNLRTTAAVGLKCALRHGTALLNLNLSIWLSETDNGIHRFQTKIEYIASVRKPQNIYTKVIFSQTLVQLLPKKNFAKESTPKHPSVCASIGNVQ
jgi:hypothetical protein